MAEITTLFWDVGGVILTNGWGRDLRRRACQHFQLDWEELEDRHELVVSAFETGAMTLDEYLQRTVFYRKRTFPPDEFKNFMFNESQPKPETLAIVAQLATSNRYLMGMLNNESRELNLYRIERYGLRRYFSVFLSSCFLGVRKPEEDIYRKALEMTQRSNRECLFIDDRALNLECANMLGMRTIHFQNAAQLQQDLERHGVEVRAVSIAKI